MGIRDIHSVNLCKIQKICILETDCRSQCAHWLRNDNIYSTSIAQLRHFLNRSRIFFVICAIYLQKGRENSVKG